MDIINGASLMLRSSIIGILCEAEFSELYLGQPLFCDIQARLRKDGFRFCDIYNSMYFNTSPYPKGLHGKGFYTFGETLFFKELDVLIDEVALESGNLSPEELGLNTIKCLKLAAVAVVFDQLDFALKIIRRLQAKKLVSLEELAEKSGCNYIKLLRDLTRAADRIEANAPVLAENSEEYGNPQKEKLRRRKYLPVAVGLFAETVIAKIIRILARRIIKKDVGNYHSEISKVFYTHGYIYYAERCDKRFVGYYFSILPKAMKKIFDAIYT